MKVRQNGGSKYDRDDWGRNTAVFHNTRQMSIIVGSNLSEF